MADEMIERVARALTLSALKRLAERAKSPGCGEDAGYAEWILSRPNEMARHVDASWRGAVDDARAAIEAMREPTTAMDIAGARADEWRSLGLQKARIIWKDMIDAALKEPVT